MAKPPKSADISIYQISINMNPLSAELAQKEYDRLCGEIAATQSETNQLARYAIIAAASVCTIIVTHQKEVANYYHLLKPMPFLIAALFSFRVFALYMRMELISTYIEKNYEKAIIQEDFPQLGWETRLNDNIRHAKPSRSFAQVSAILFWSILNLLCFIFIFI